MTNLQYKDAVLKALESSDNSTNSVDEVRKILSGCDVDFPYGECEGILNVLSNNKFAQWHECSSDNALKLANDGIPTVGICKKQIIVIIPDDETAESGIVRTANSLTADERENYKFFSNTNVRAVNGWTSDVPKNQTTDGFGGWYHRGCWSEGVVGHVPRFVQMDWGPCLAYSIMSGCYNLYHSNEDVYTFFDNRLGKYIDSSGNALWRSFATVQSFNMSYMKETLDANEPVIISGNNSKGTRHFALVVAYTGKGLSNSDFTVVDPWHDAPFPTTYEEFLSRFGYAATFDSVKNPMLIFK